METGEVRSNFVVEYRRLELEKHLGLLFDVGADVGEVYAFQMEVNNGEVGSRRNKAYIGSMKSSVW